MVSAFCCGWRTITHELYLLTTLFSSTNNMNLSFFNSINVLLVWFCTYQRFPFL
jgi:hypothetical protein